MGRNINTYPLVPEPSLNDKLLGSQNNIGTTYNWTISQVSSLINSSESLTRDEMLNLISDPLESLTVSRFYKIIDADSSTEEVIVQAVSSDALSEICLQVSDPSNLYRYVIENDTLTVFSGGGGGIPEAPQDGTTYGRKDAAWHEVVTTLPQSVERTGATLVFDVMEGAIYNAATPSNSATIAIDALTPAKRGCVVAFYNDGSVEPTITGATPNPQAGAWVSGQVNVYWFMWDGHSFTQNIQTKTAAVLPTLDDPTYTLAAGAALELDYAFLTTDANATGGVFQISTDATFATGTESVVGYVFGVDGTITTFGGSPLTATTYYTRLQSTASGYNSSGFTEESATATATPTLSTPTIVATAGNTENVITLTTAALPTPDSDTLEFRNVTLGGTFASVPTYSGMPYTHTGLTNGEEYEYRYTAIKAGYNSAEATDSATPIVAATPVDFTGKLGPTLSETSVGSEIYEPSAGTNTNWATSVNTYSGEFDFEILVDDALIDIKTGIGVSLDNRNVEFGTAFNGGVEPYIPCGLNTKTAGSTIREFTSSPTPQITAVTNDWSSGNKYRIIRDASNVVRGYYDTRASGGTLQLAETWATPLVGAVYLLMQIAPASDPITWQARFPRVTGTPTP